MYKLSPPQEELFNHDYSLQFVPNGKTFSLALFNFIKCSLIKSLITCRHQALEHVLSIYQVKIEQQWTQNRPFVDTTVYHYIWCGVISILIKKTWYVYLLGQKQNKSGPIIKTWKAPDDNIQCCVIGILIKEHLCLFNRSKIEVQWPEIQPLGDTT